MITKEDARLIYNLYAQIETTEKLIEDLKNFAAEQDEMIPDVIPESYSSHGSIELCVPTFKEGRFQTGSATVYNISYHAALRVLNNHIETLKSKVKQLNERLIPKIEAAEKISKDSNSPGTDGRTENKPTLDDYTTIKTYEDACEALGENPLPYEPNPIMVLYGVEYEIPSHMIALMKLETISRALWGKEWKPEPDAEGSKWFYYPLFALYTQSEIENMGEEKREGLLSALASNGAYAGFGYLYTTYRSSSAHAYYGFRLCQETQEKAEYFGKQFIELWAEYLKFGFEVGGRLK